MVAALRSDWMREHDDDLVPRLVSWAIAFAFGAAWLLVVYLTPLATVPPASVSPTPGSGIVDFAPGLMASTAAPVAVPKQAVPGQTDHGIAHVATSKLELAGIFAAAGAERAVEQISRLIPGVSAVQGDVGPRGNGGKALVATGADQGTPGISRFSGGVQGGAAQLGRVQSGASIGHADVHVRPLPIVAAPAPGAALADASEMGTFVRARVSQLQNCYERNGGTDIAGVVALRLTIGDAGAVRSADIVRRTWSGPGAAATEQCLLDLVRGWRMPFAGAGATITIPISFTRGT